VQGETLSIVTKAATGEVRPSFFAKWDSYSRETHMRLSFVAVSSSTLCVGAWLVEQRRSCWLREDSKPDIDKFPAVIRSSGDAGGEKKVWPQFAACTTHSTQPSNNTNKATACWNDKEKHPKARCCCT
jgi:hypothetical protein